MAQLTDLPSDIFNVILLYVVASNDGARDLVRIGATCKTFLDETKKLSILKVVNFKRLTFTTYNFIQHYQEKGLLCLCARAGNESAHSMLGKALLLDDWWFWRMMANDYSQSLQGLIDPNEALFHHSLIRAFILHAPSLCICKLRRRLLKYVSLYAGYINTCECGLQSAIWNLCFFEGKRLLNYNFFVSLKYIVFRVDPPYDPSYREAAVQIYDEVFSPDRY